MTMPLVSSSTVLHGASTPNVWIWEEMKWEPVSISNKFTLGFKSNSTDKNDSWVQKNQSSLFFRRHLRCICSPPLWSSAGVIMQYFLISVGHREVIKTLQITISFSKCFLKCCVLSFRVNVVVNLKNSQVNRATPLLENVRTRMFSTQLCTVSLQANRRSFL